MESQLGLIEQSFNVRYSVYVREVLDELPDSFTITDPCISGHPIVFASRGFLKMTGYSRDEVIGKNGRMFQGPKTDRRSVMEIREAIREERSIQISVLNYRRDGTPFWILFHMCPVFSREDGRVIHFVGVQVPILRRQRCSASGFGRNGVNLCEDGCGFRESLLGSCRREVCSDSVVELGHVLDMNLGIDSDDREIEVKECCEASDLEKQRAKTSINSILSVLSHYSELTGRLVCGKRCCLPGMGLLGSLNIPLGRIKQSFVLTDPNLPDMPIVYASDAFLNLTGYARHEVLGRNCRFLSGEDTDLSAIFQIKQSIQAEQACTEGQKLVLELTAHFTCSECFWQGFLLVKFLVLVLILEPETTNSGYDNKQVSNEKGESLMHEVPCFTMIRGGLFSYGALLLLREEAIFTLRTFNLPITKEQLYHCYQS